MHAQSFPLKFLCLVEHQLGDADDVHLIGVLLEPVVERVVVLRLPLLFLHNLATISASHSGKVTTGERGHQLMEC